MGTGSNARRRLTRRGVLKAGATALGGGAALLTGMPDMARRTPQAPAVLTGTQTGRTFRGLVRHDTTLDVQPMRLLRDRPATGRHPLASRRPCYTIVRGALSTNAIRPRRGPEPLRLRRRRGGRRDGQARAGRRPRRRRRHVAVRPVLPVPAWPAGLLPVHVLLERAGRRAIRSVCASCSTAHPSTRRQASAA